MSTIKLTTTINRTPRVMQLEGIFDLQSAKISVTEVPNNIPDLGTRDWNIGLIVGPSGAGKTTIAKNMFGQELASVESMAWSANNAVIDDFPTDMPIKDITELLSSVGFSSSVRRQLLKLLERVSKSLSQYRAIMIFKNGYNPIGFINRTSVPFLGSRFNPAHKSIAKSFGQTIRRGKYSLNITI